ncbi:MAG: hypothetical protein IKR85_02915 [Clostridia bacterium]|nr:hypothetical protein [Clostridia bacterium]
MKPSTYVGLLFAAMCFAFIVIVLCVVMQEPISNALVFADNNNIDGDFFSLQLVFSAVTAFSTLTIAIFLCLKATVNKSGDKEINITDYLSEDESRLLEYYHDLDEDDRRKARKSVKKLSTGNGEKT